MDACPACSAALPANARFCARCGLPTTDEPQSIDLFLSPSAGNQDSGQPDTRRSTSPQSEESSGGSHLRTVAVLATSLLAGLLIWGNHQQPKDVPIRPEAPQAGPVAGSSSTQQSGGVAIARSPDRNPDRNEATEFFDGEFTSDVFVDLSVVGPLLADENVGYRLVVSSDSQLFDIDLDTGEMTRHRIVVDPIGLLGDELIAFDPERGFVALPTDNLGGDGRTVFAVPEVAATDRAVGVANLLAAAVRPPQTLLAEFVRPEPGTGRVATQLFEIDVSTGRFAATSIAVDPRPQTPHRTRNGLAALDGGGVFEAAGNSYRKIADGQALLLGVNYSVARDCPTPGDCRVFWVDRATGNEVERPLPTSGEINTATQRPDGAGTERALMAMEELDAGATVVAITGPESTGSGYYDVENGRRLTALDPLSLEFGLGPLGRSVGALSPDGRWMALPVGGSIVLYDRRTELLYRRGSGPSAVLKQFVFVPTSQ